MKTQLSPQAGRSVLSLCPPLLALTLLWAALPARGDTTFTSTGWLYSAPLPGIMCTNGNHQVYLKGNSHVVRLLSSDPRTTGRMEAWMDLAYQPDGTATFSGPAYAEVGTWDASGTNFTPSGGVWCINYSGTAQPDGSSQYTMAGYGLGGTIEGMRFTGAATRAAPGSPAEPYVVSGVLKPAPVNTRVVVEDFSDGRAWTIGGAGAGQLRVVETNGVCTIVGDWRGHATWNLYETTAWAGMYTNWTVPDGQTMEARVDLEKMDADASGVCLALYHANGQGYAFSKAGDSAGIWKHDGVLACLTLDRVTTRNTNVVLTLAITPAGQNVLLLGQVLDKQTGAVLYQQQCVDTPAADPTLTQQQIAQLTGCRVWHDWGAEPAGDPWKSGNSVCLFVFQDTDGTKPPVGATFDTVEFLKYEIPRLSIEPAVRLTWPSTGMNFGIQSAPTVNGPWSAVQDSVPTGFQQMTIPQTGPMKFYQAVQAP